MISANELRIGNLISVSGFGELEVSFINNDMVGFDNRWIRQCTYSAAKPIPISEGWLLRAGFAQNDSSKLSWTIQVTQWKKFTIVFYKNKPQAWTFPYHHQADTLVSFHYVHQLQNLFFALMRQELEIKQSKTTKQ